MVKKHNYTLQFHFHDDLIDNYNDNNYNTYTAQYTIYIWISSNAF